MPTSDAIFFAIGLADYVFVFAFIAVTGFISRKGAAKQKTGGTAK